MNKSLVSIILTEREAESDEPLSCQFEPDKAENYKNNDFCAVIIDTITDEKYWSDTQKRMVQELDYFMTDCMNDPKMLVSVKCYDRNHDLVTKLDSKSLIDVTENIRPYLYEREVDGQRYDVIDFVVRVESIGGSYDTTG